jgi:hypothetical protein
MHFPQLPDENGFDIDWGTWKLADDWRCSETGTVDDIHFWISWFFDDPLPIPEIYIEIWSNNPVGPGGWSIPDELLWEQTFAGGEFIEAGPWPGNQLWMMPWGEIIPMPHFFYWQINIPQIDEPFIQFEGEVYWLVIRIPHFGPNVVGWKNTQNYYLDHAVWWDDVNWMKIDGIDFSFVITGSPLTPAIDCEAELSWPAVKPGGTKTGTIDISNIGDPFSELDWEITEWPVWGTWTFNPDSGVDLTPEASPETVQVTVIAPKGEGTARPLPPRDQTYTGQIKITNLDDPTDFCIIDVTLTTAKNKPFTYNFILLRWLFDNFPNAFPILRTMIQL